LGSVGWAAGEDVHSARREPGLSYLAYKAHAVLMAQGARPLNVSPVEEAKPYGQTKATLPAATLWKTEVEMKQNFDKFRDHRFLERSSQPGFLRRSSWLYPDDGCFARAALAVLNLGKLNVTLPKKVFVFGDLDVKTINSPNGSVSWWYHVAPLVEIDGVKYVLDPAIEPRNPLRLEDWLSRMNANPDNLEVAICGSGSYTPYDACHKESDGVESSALSDQGRYLDSEWYRLKSLGRIPEEELGDSPPWLSPVNLP
jgi:hypothetical protein